MTTRTVVIANPASRSGALSKRLDELRRLLDRHVADYELVLTERSGHGVSLAREAALALATRVVAVGGDGTANEVLNGLLDSGRANEVSLALLPLGTGCDFARTLRLGTDLEQAVRRIEQGRTRRVDVGRLRCRGGQGGEVTRCFLNIASCGASAYATQWLERRKTRGPLSYLAGGVVSLFGYASPPVSVRVDGAPLCDERVSLVTIANGRFFGGGMRVAPLAVEDDGVFDVMAVPRFSLLESLRHYPKLASGALASDARVYSRRGRVVELEGVRVPLEADGEPLGDLPARIELLAGAITLAGLP